MTSFVKYPFGNSLGKGRMILPSVAGTLSLYPIISFVITTIMYDTLFLKESYDRARRTEGICVHEGSPRWRRRRWRRRVAKVRRAVHGRGG